MPVDEVVVEAFAVSEPSDGARLWVDVEGHAGHEDQVKQSLVGVVGVRTSKHHLALVDRGRVDAGNAPFVCLEGLIVMEVSQTNHVHDTGWKIGCGQGVLVQIRDEDLLAGL